MTSRARFVLPALLLCLVTAVPAAALDLGGHVRDGVVVGVLLGGGWNDYNFEVKGLQPTSVSSGSAFTGGVNVGWARNDHLVGSIGFYGWKKSFYNNITPINSSAYYFMGEVSWFPRGEGFWIKGGIGWANSDFTVVTPEEWKVLAGNTLAYALGAGYEFRLGGTTALGIAYDARWADYGESDFFYYNDSLLQTWSLSIRYYAD